MIYLNRIMTKVYLILLCGLVTLNVVFVETKTFTAKADSFEIANASEIQYQIYLSSLSFRRQSEFVNNTEIKYFNNLPEKSLLYIYLGYFLVATAFILTTKFSLSDSSNENR
jgi:hypothetical protein